MALARGPHGQPLDWNAGRWCTEADPQWLPSLCERGGLADATIRSVFQTSEGELYAVSAYQRIHRFDGSGFTAVRPNLSRDLADVMNAGTPLRDHAGEWWIPGGAGLYRFAAVDTVEHLKRARPKAIYTTQDGLSGDDVFHLFEDSRTDIWIRQIRRPRHW